MIPRNPLLNIYLHNIRRSDNDQALHDHPWWNVSIVLRGGYLEHLPRRRKRWRAAGSVVFRLGKSAHRLEIVPGIGPTWSLFITGPRFRRWGFRCPKGWVHWKEFTRDAAQSLAGSGCGEP